MYDPETRRQFLRKAAALATAAPLTAWSSRTRAEEPPAPAARSDRLRIGVIGVRGRGEENLNEVASQEIVALCDVDRRHLEAAQKQFPKAAAHEDYRRLLDQKGLDAVLVATPDHMHALPVVAAIQAGLQVYCEKPLAHSVHEVRVIRQLAAKHKTVTQMGTQIHAGENYRRVVEIVQAGVIGPVRRVHVWQEKRPNSGWRAKDDAQPPAHLNYDLWLGPAPFRPYHPSHLHFDWRFWWDFGGGVLADMACHFVDLPFWALALHAPDSIEATGKKEHEGDNDVPTVMRVDYQFPARGAQPPVHLTWYHGGWKPEGAEVYKKGSAVLFEGDKGLLLADYGSRKVILGSGTAVEPVPTIPNSIGHHREWLEAIRTRGPTTCNFEYSGELTEAVLLGNVAYRAGKKIEWDAQALAAKNAPEAAPFIRREYRKGWSLT
jgi:predicted dehydrogenase